MRTPRLAKPSMLAIEKPDRLGGLRQVDGDEVGLGHELRQRHEVDAHLPAAVGRDEGVIREQAHSERERPLRHELPDPPEADDAQHLVVQLDAFPPGALPATILQGRVRLRDVPGLREQQRQRVLGSGQHVRLRRVHDHHTATSRGFDVDVVEADARTSHDDEVARSLQHLGRHLGRRPDDERMGAGDHIEQIRG